jgi:hypothetical protein
MATRFADVPMAYRPSSARVDSTRLNGEPVLPVDLAGVPTIPADVHAFLIRGNGGNPVETLPDELAERSAAAIRQACAEIRQRKALLIVPFVPAASEADDADD